MQEKKLYQKEMIEIIKNNNYGNLCLSKSHQPYAKYMAYNWDMCNGTLEILLDTHKNSMVGKIINCNDKCAFLINCCFCNGYDSILITGKVYILEDNSTDKDSLNLIIVPDSINGKRYYY